MAQLSAKRVDNVICIRHNELANLHRKKNINANSNYDSKRILHELQSSITVE